MAYKYLIIQHYRSKVNSIQSFIIVFSSNLSRYDFIVVKTNRTYQLSLAVLYFEASWFMLRKYFG